MQKLLQFMAGAVGAWHLPCFLVEFQRFDLQLLGQFGAGLQLILQILNTAGFVDGLHVVLLLVASQQHGFAGIRLWRLAKR